MKPPGAGGAGAARRRVPPRAVVEPFDETRWRLPVFRLMLPIAVLISVEQYVVATNPSVAFAAAFAAVVLTLLWLLAWHPRSAAATWLGPLGDIVLLTAVTIGCVVDGAGVLLLDRRDAAVAMQTLAFWVPTIALYFNLVLHRWRLLLTFCLSLLIGLFVAAHWYALRKWNIAILLESTTSFIGQVIITSGVAVIFSRYRTGLSSAVAQLRVAEAESMTDSLTALPNRRNFYTDARQRWNGEPDVALLVLDIDDFKAVNDTLGHHAGDEVLASFAATVRDWLHEDVHFYRWGGEEFVLVATMPGRDAAAFAERLREHVAGVVLPFGVRLTVSIGGSVFAASESVESAFQRADRASYEAKRGGRNRVVFRLD